MHKYQLCAHRSLESLHPAANRNGGDRQYSLHLAYGSHSPVILRGGPLPMVEEPDSHFTSRKFTRRANHRSAEADPIFTIFK